MTGLVSVPMHPGAARMVASWVPWQSRSLANGLVTAAALLGIASTYYLFGMLIDRFGWPMAFMISGSVTFVISLAWMFYATNSPAGHWRSTSAEFRLIVGHAAEAQSSGDSVSMYSLLGNRSLVLLTLSYSAVGYFQYLFFYWLEYYFKDVLQLSTDTSRLYATMPDLAMAAGMFLGGWLADDLSRRVGAAPRSSTSGRGRAVGGDRVFGSGSFRSRSALDRRLVLAGDGSRGDERRAVLGHGD